MKEYSDVRKADCRDHNARLIVMTFIDIKEYSEHPSQLDVEYLQKFSLDAYNAWNHFNSSYMEFSMETCYIKIPNEWQHVGVWLSEQVYATDCTSFADEISTKKEYVEFVVSAACELLELSCFHKKYY